MRMIKGAFPFIAALLLAAGPALADKYSDTVNLFKNAGQSASFFGNSYGYAVFPTTRQAGPGLGGERRRLVLGAPGIVLPQRHRLRLAALVLEPQRGR